ncbi:hypothetical protein IG631_12694 [Alternaria alternata]|nr:hypothetical protein IG631_12694 [Alternaria alternata]
MDASFPESVQMELKRDLSSHAKRANSTEGGLFEKYQYFTPGLFMGFAAIIPLFLILLVGIRALTSLERNTNIVVPRLCCYLRSCHADSRNPAYTKLEAWTSMHAAGPFGRARLMMLPDRFPNALPRTRHAGTTTHVCSQR